jgi:methionyl-tRNA formyltransferase
MSLRVLFCGTPEFALPTLHAVAASPHMLVGVVTAPDRPKGRGLKPAPPALKRAAEALGLPVWQPEDLTEPAFLEAVRQGAPDILLVVAFRILPEALFRGPRFGAVNVHASLLPEYRGAAPIARALMDGRDRTGVTTFQIVHRVDRGGILLQRTMPIAPEDNAGTLSEKLARAGAELALETLDGLAAGALSPRPQDDALATRAPKLTAADRPVRWGEPARVSHNRVRALAPHPGAVVRRKDKYLKVLETEYSSVPVAQAPGHVIDRERPDGIAVATGEGTLVLRLVQPEGKKVMTVAAYLRGHPLSPDERFE